MLAANTNIAPGAQQQNSQSPLELHSYYTELPTLTKQLFFHQASLTQRWQLDASLVFTVQPEQSPQSHARKERTVETRMVKISQIVDPVLLVITALTSVQPIQ